MQGRRKQELKLIAVWLNLKTDSYIFAFAYRFLRYSSQTLKQHGTYSAQTQNTFYLKLKAFNSINSQLREISSCVLSRIIQQCIIPVAVLSTTGGAAVGDGGGLDPGAVQKEPDNRIFRLSRNTRFLRVLIFLVFCSFFCDPQKQAPVKIYSTSEIIHSNEKHK